MLARSVLLRSTALLLASWALASAGHAQEAEFLPLPPAFAGRALSHDGSVVVGWASPGPPGGTAFRWTREQGLVDLGSLPGQVAVLALDVSAAGDVIVGAVRKAGNACGFPGFLVGSWEGFRWTQSEGMVGLGGLNGPDDHSIAWTVSGDGELIGGEMAGCSCRAPGYWFGGSWFSDPSLPCQGRITSMSASGASFAGRFIPLGDPTFQHRAFKFDFPNAFQDLGTLPGDTYSVAEDISADGAVVVGWSGSEAFRWTSRGMTGLGHLPGRLDSNALAVSGDGSIVVGTSGNRAFVWTPTDGMLALQDFLVDRYGLGCDLEGWILEIAFDISGDGSTIVGSGTLDGVDGGWLVHLGTPLPSCGIEPGPESCPPAAPTAGCCGRSSGTAALDPVNLFSGEFYESCTDLRVAGRGLDLVWSRKYRSQRGPTTELGNGWDWSYNVRLLQQGPDLVVCDGASRRDTYRAQPGGTWTALEFFREIQPDPQGGLRLTFEDTGRWEFHAFDGSPWEGKVRAIVDRSGNELGFAYDAQGRLTAITDTLGRPTTLVHDAQGRVTSVTDFTGRQVRYAYYQPGESGGSPGDLKSVTTPDVTGTPNGNDYPDGKTTVYTYSTGFADERLNHNLLTITDPKGQTYLQNVYAATTDPADLDFDRIVRQAWGDPGDLIDIVHVSQTPGPANGFATVKVIVNDRMGNVEESSYDARNRLVLRRQYAGRAPDPQAPTTETANRPAAKLRPGDPDYFETRWEYNADSLATRVVHPNGNEEVFSYDEQNPDARARGNLLEHRWLPGPLGGDQAQVSDFFEYDDGFGGCCGSNFVTRHTDGEGHVTEHDYDANGNRIQTRHAIAGIVEDFEYNAAGQMTAHVLPDDGSGHRRRDERTYHGSGPQTGYLASEVVDAQGLALATSYEYDDLGRLVRTLDPRGADTLLVYNQLDQVVRRKSREVAPGGGLRYETDLFYDANGNVARVDVQNVRDDGTVDPANTHFTTVHDFDVLNHVVRTCRERGIWNGPAGQLTCVGLPAGEFVTEEYEYDRNRNRTLVRMGEAAGGRQPTNVVRSLYDERNLVFRRVRAEGDAAQSTTQYDYDPNGNLMAEREGLEGTAQVTLHVHDGYDRPVSTTDPMGNVRQRTYGANHDLVLERLDGELLDVPGGGGNVRLEESAYAYDDLDRLVQHDRAHFDSLTQLPIGDGLSRTATDYTDASQEQSATDDNGNTRTTAYDTAHRVALVTDAQGNSMAWTYDAGSNVVARVELERSSLGSTDQAFTTSFTYDGLDRSTSTTDSAGNVTQVAYDSRGNRTRVVDALGRETRYAYDGLSRLVETVHDMDGDGADASDEADIVLRQSWDDSSRLRTRTDDNGNTTAYEYDALDRRTATILPDGTQETRTYDVHDRVVLRSDPNGSLVVATYDELDRLIGTTITPAAGVSGATTAESFAWDGASRLVRAQDDDSLVERRHDSLSNVTREQLDGAALDKVFDGVGNAVAWTYPGGRSLTCSYDALNRPQALVDASAGPVATFHYFGPRRLERVELGNGTRTDHAWDGVDGVPNAPGDRGARRTSEILHSRVADGAVIERRSFAWSATQHRLRRADLRPSGPGLEHDYAYDAADRLVGSLVRAPGGAVVGSRRHALDGVGNRRGGEPGRASASVPAAESTVVARPAVARYSMDATVPEPADRQMNQYTQTPFDRREYDANGNLVRLRAPGGVQRDLTYDHRDRLVEVAGGTSATYRHDALGRRVEKSVSDGGGPPEVIRFHYDGWRSIEERDELGAPQATYVHGLGPDDVLEMTRAGQRIFYHSDDLQSVLALTDAAGDVVERFEYGDYGSPVSVNGTRRAGTISAVGNPYLFTGRYHDPETRWYEHRTRHLDPIAGRFVSRDRIGAWGDARGLGNAFAYAGHSPWSMADPFGLAADAPADDEIDLFVALHDQDIYWGVFKEVVQARDRGWIPVGFSFSLWSGEQPDVVADRLHDHTGPGTCVRNLMLSGHQSTMGDPTPGLGETNAEKVLTAKFCSDCTIYLAGCGTSEKARALSMLTSCRVCGSTGSMRAGLFFDVHHPVWKFACYRNGAKISRVRGAPASCRGGCR